MIDAVLKVLKVEIDHLKAKPEEGISAKKQNKRAKRLDDLNKATEGLHQLKDLAESLNSNFINKF